MTDNQRTWIDRVREWRASGMTAPEFALGRGFAPSKLRYWASQLRHELATTPPPRALRRVRMARVEVAPSIPASALVVEIAGARIEIQTGFDRALLREVVDALGSGGAR